VHRFAELIAPSRLGRSFRWLLASSWVTNLGDGITLAAGPLLVASQTRNPLTVAMAALLQRLRPGAKYLYHHERRVGVRRASQHFVGHQCSHAA